MALTFWGWEGKREDVTSYVKPFLKDKNVMPYELVDFVNTQTSLRALTRDGGTPELLKNLVANGFPVMVERGVYLRDLTGKISWMGHYQVVHGYDDELAQYNVKDSFEKGGSNFIVSYDDLIRGWRSFNYAFLLVYPSERKGEVLALLGSYADETSANQAAAAIASDDVFQTEGQDQFFAWYNRGSSLTWLQDYAGAAEAYDNAFAAYAELPAENRPWRATWYQTGPYFAYFFTGRYQDVLALADQTITSASEPYLEESFYWRARAKAALGDTNGAIEDLRQSLEYHPGFNPSLEMLAQMGVAQ
jgi:tetratricopeptide (TPR) repeat protein